MEIDYLTPAEIYGIAQDVLGYEPRVRDRHLLRKAAGRPMLVIFGEEMFPSLLEKAAALLHSFAAHHLLFDGNKRTATAVTTRFLQMNNIQPAWDDFEIIAFVLQVAQDQVEIPQIAEWLATHTKTE